MKQHINLVNPALLPPKPFFQFRTMLLALGSVALLLILLGVFIRFSLATYLDVAEQAQARVKARETQLQAQQALLKVRVKNPQLALDIAAAGEELARLQQVAASLPGQSGGVRPAASLQALSGAVMPGVWLKLIEIQQGALSLQGYALRPEQIPEYLERLHQQEAFRGQRFEAFELGRGVAGSPLVPAAAEAIAFRLRALGRGEQP